MAEICKRQKIWILENSGRELERNLVLYERPQSI